MARPSEYDKSVFINCPFDRAYKPLFEAMVFAVFDCGFRPRCALEADDAGQVRMEKIFDLIAECRLGINDLSRADLDSTTNLPRFNMPLELGIFLGARRYGQGRQNRKRCLILDRERYRYRSFISDIAGQDIQEHRDSPGEAIRVIRNWLRHQSPNSEIPGGRIIGERYQAFRADLPDLCQKAKLDQDELIWVDYISLISVWLSRNT
jgi:hypothetical protein